MGLLTGETLGPLAVAVAIFLLLVDLMHRRQRWAPCCPPAPCPCLGWATCCRWTSRTRFALPRHFGNVFSLQLPWMPVVVLNGLMAVPMH
uniref:Uncharacterized protein n=1 Tax=Equus asinus asinus TaxID=83772 RepID=A0A8C4KSK9_EQUAS